MKLSLIQIGILKDIAANKIALDEDTSDFLLDQLVELATLDGPALIDVQGPSVILTTAGQASPHPCSADMATIIRNCQRRDGKSLILLDGKSRIWDCPGRQCPCRQPRPKPPKQSRARRIPPQYTRQI